MPTRRPKLNFVVSTPSSEAVIRAGLDDLSSINRSSMSAEVERILLDAVLTDNPPVRAIMENVYSQASTVRDVVAQEFSDASASIGMGTSGVADAMLPIVEFASGRSTASTVCMQAEDGMGGLIVYHARTCWDSVAGKLRDAERDGCDLGAALDAEEASKRLAMLDPDGGPIDASGFYGIVLRNWRVLGQLDYCYRALMDIVRMSSPWREDAQTRSGLKDALVASYSLRVR